MVDMGQADGSLRIRQPTLRYGWEDVKDPVSVSNGDLCVIRSSNGSPEVLRIEPQTSYREWAGCFTYCGVLK